MDRIDDGSRETVGDTMEKIKISSDNDAVALLERLLTEDIDISAVEFVAWPIYTLYLKGDKYDRSITPSLMRPLLELQKGLYKTASRAIYNDDNTNRLTEEQREKFEYKLQVLEGSSDTKADWHTIFADIIKSAVGKMSGKQALILLLSAGLMYTGHSMYAKYIDHLDKAEASEQAVKSQEILAETTKAQQQAATKQLEIMAEVVKKYPQVQQTMEEAEEVHYQVLREARDADKVMVNGVALTGDEARDLTGEDRKKSAPAKFVEQFRVLAVDTSDATKTKVKVRKGKFEFWASFNDETLDSRAIRLLQRHLISREPVRLRIEGKKLGEKVINARIIAVAPKLGQANVSDK